MLIATSDARTNAPARVEPRALRAGLPLAGGMAGRDDVGRGGGQNMWRYSRGFPSIYRDRMGRLASSDVAAEMGSDRFGPTSSDVANGAPCKLRRCGRDGLRPFRPHKLRRCGGEASAPVRRCAVVEVECLEAAPTLRSKSPTLRSNSRADVAGSEGFEASPTLRGRGLRSCSDVVVGVEGDSKPEALRSVSDVALRSRCVVVEGRDVTVEVELRRCWDERGAKRLRR